MTSNEFPTYESVGPTRLVAIDPGADQGWALFEDGTLTDCGLGVYFDIGVQAVIELPEYRPSSRVNPNDLIQLALKVGDIAGLYRAGGVEPVLLKPSQWKGSVPKTIHGERIRNALNAAELDILSRVRCAPSKLHNVVDAIGLGLFHLGRIGRGGK